VTKQKIAIVVLSVILLAGTGVGLYFIFRPVDVNVPPIQANQEYYLQERYIGLFRYPDATGMPSSNIITKKTNDKTHAKFSSDWKTFTLSFWLSGDDFVDFVFVITNISQNKKNLTATVRHIYDGDLREYRIRSTKDTFILTTTMIYKIKTSSSAHAPAPTEEVFRANTDVLAFRRVAPAYITQGANP